ncbi:oxidoreductase [Colletotrichum abscissum]|uniref:Oxidoreductase n=1 Tax=Colletotrichum abscissum TaxID=1671311 RepID=A0A9P9XNF7_9PEZI|nr:oxidoreductase [Colletotrichum abscissum]KAI3556422.1 oxidoreductase [Colletotrichum abscissum]KAK1475527.1 oxidoreductase [Colletotrichum abscissum]
MSSVSTLRELAKQVSETISDDDLSGSTFAIGGEVPIEQPQGDSSPTAQVASSSVVLRWDNPAEHPGPQRVSFPVASDDDAVAFKHLLKASEKATFGLNGRH